MLLSFFHTNRPAMTTNDHSSTPSDQTPNANDTTANPGDSVLPQLGRRVVDMSSINSQNTHRSTVCYPPAKAASRKDKHDKKGHKKAPHVSGEQRAVAHDKRNHFKERRNSIQAHAVSKEKRNLSQEQHAVAHGKRHFSQEQRAISKEKRNLSQEQQAVSKEKQSQELPGIIKEKQSQETAAVTKDKRNLSQDLVAVSKDRQSQELHSVKNHRRNLSQEQQAVAQERRAFFQNAERICREPDDDMTRFPLSSQYERVVRSTTPIPRSTFSTSSAELPSVSASFDAPGSHATPHKDDDASESEPAYTPSSDSNRKPKIKPIQKQKKYDSGTHHHAITGAQTSSASFAAVPSASSQEPNFAPVAPGSKSLVHTRIPSGQHDKISIHKSGLHPKRMHVSSGAYSATTRSGIFRKARQTRYALRHGDHLHARTATREALADRISDMFLFQSWHARQWIRTIGNISEDYLAYMERAIPTVQAKLYSDFEEEDGIVHVNVISHKAMLKLLPYSEGQWRTVVTEISNQAIFSTEILNNILTEELVSLFRNNGVNLFPQGRGESEKKKKKEDLITFCEDCQTTRCEHVGALILIIAQRIEENPMFLIRLRGCSPEKLNRMLRLERSDQAIDPSDKSATNYELPASRPNYQNFYTPADEHLYDFKFDVKSEPQTSVLERLKDPEVWQAPISLNACLMPLMNFAAQDADELYHTCHQYSLPCEKLNPALNVSDLPDISFLIDEIPHDMIASMSRDITEATYELLTRLSKDGADDIRTLARQTRIKKEVVELIIQSLLEHELILPVGEEDKPKFVASFANKT